MAVPDGPPLGCAEPCEIVPPERQTGLDVAGVGTGRRGGRGACPQDTAGDWLDTLPDWATSSERAYLQRLPAHERAVLDEYVRWLGPAAAWTTFATFTFPDKYAEENKGLYGPAGTSKWCKRFLGSMGYDGSYVISPEGHRWRDVYHAHVLLERCDWRAVSHEYTRLTDSVVGLDLGRSTDGAVAYALKYALKDGLSEHQLIQLGTEGMLAR